jgi:hypothetical protein
LDNNLFPKDSAYIEQDLITSPARQDVIQLFIGIDTGFLIPRTMEFKATKYGVQRISVNFKESDKITRLRVDPSHYPCVALFKRFEVNGVDVRQKINGNNIDIIENLFYFWCDNPRLYYSSKEPIISLECEMIIDKGTFASTFYNMSLLARDKTLITNAEKEKLLLDTKEKIKLEKMVSEQKNELLLNIGETAKLKALIKTLQDNISHLNNANSALIEKNLQLKEQLLRSTEKINKVLSSTSWKITKPLRTAMDFLKKIIGVRFQKNNGNGKSR